MICFGESHLGNEKNPSILRRAKNNATPRRSEKNQHDGGERSLEGLRNVGKFSQTYLGVSKNRGTPKWMVYNGNPIKMDDLEVPLFSQTSILSKTIYPKNLDPFLEWD